MSYSPAARVASISRRTSLRSTYNRTYASCYKYINFGSFNLSCNCRTITFIQHFSTSVKPEGLCQEGSSYMTLLKKLETSLKDHQLDEAWQAYTGLKSLYGLPNRSLLHRLITELFYTSDPNWLQKAYNLVVKIQKEKSDLIQTDLLTKLSLSLARAQKPISSSMILRMVLQEKNSPPLDMLGLIILHLLKTKVGTHLASNILAEICECFPGSTAGSSAAMNLNKPDTTIFNLVLDACVRFGSSFKGQQIIELMAQVRVIADAHTIVIIAQIFEMNGQRDELKKLKDYVDHALVPLAHHYQQFYDSLLSSHFKFCDIDAAFGLILEIYGGHRSLHSKEHQMLLHRPCFMPVGSHYLRTGLKLHILPQLLQKDSVLKMEKKQEFIVYKNGKLAVSSKVFARLILHYKRCDKISELSKLLSVIQSKVAVGQQEALCSDVIDACIYMGWLETAHDILEDLELALTPVGARSYISLLAAYHKKNMSREADVLLKQMRKAGLVINTCDDGVDSNYLSNVADEKALCLKCTTSTAKSDLVKSIVHEMREGKAAPSVVHELNSSIYFFMKAKMVEDASSTYKRMQVMKIQPNVATFFNLVNGYSSLKLYREITILWGDIKRSMDSRKLLVNRDLYELLLLNFLRGGYFERVMEVIGHMKDHRMYLDKWMYKREFLKFHKDLYRNLKASNVRNEAQSKRLENVRAFKKWVGIN